MKNRMNVAIAILLALLMLLASACGTDVPDTTEPDLTDPNVTDPTDTDPTDTDPADTDPTDTESDTSKEKEPVTAKENGLILEILKPASGREYGSFYVYVQTSDPSGQYYVKYNFAYEYNDARTNYAGNTTTNISNYRIKSAQLVKVSAVGETAVTSTKIYEVLQQGEISLAIRQEKVDTAILAPGATLKDGLSGDFIGGYHGDERIESVSLTADGDPIDLKGKTAQVIVCTTLAFNQVTTLYKWGTSTAESFGVPAATHSQSFSIDTHGVRNRQSVEWLCGDFHTRSSATFLQMFTMMRQSGGRVITDILESFDENGKSLGKETVDTALTANKAYLKNTRLRAVEYGSETSGVSAVAGFRIVEGAAVDAAYVSARASQKDNKLYVSFKSEKNGRTPALGEVWTVDLFYTIDYIKPEA